MRRMFELLLVRLLVEGGLILLVIAGAMALQRLCRKSPLPLVSPISTQLAVTCALCGAIVAAYSIVVRWVEQRAVVEAIPDPRSLVLGVIVGFNLCCASYLVLAAIGVASWGGLSGTAELPAAFLTALLVATGEEVFFRGVCFRLLEDGLGTAAAVILSAVLFGAMHAGNPGATYLSTVAVGLEAGVLLAAAYVWSRSLWLVISLHFAWNFTEGGIFGAPVSGAPMRGWFDIRLSRTAPDIVTGGAFGPEASVITVAVCLVAAIIFATAASRLGHWQPWRFRLRTG